MQECQVICLLLMNSSKAKLGENPAPKTGDSNPSLALADLANLRDDSAAFERFASRWPDFSEVLDSDPAPTDSYFQYHYGEPMTRMPAKLPTRFLRIWQRREALRQIWRGNSEKLFQVLLPTEAEMMMDLDPDWVWNPQLKLDWQRGEFVYTPQGEFQAALYRLFRRSAFAKLCGNPNCPAPYFIAHKTTQRYCTGECAQVFQKEWKRRWWKEKGTEWRREKSRKKRGKR